MTLVDHMLSVYEVLALKRNHSVIPVRLKQGWRDGSAEDLSLVLSTNSDSQSSDLCRPCIHIVYIYTLRYIHIELHRYLKSKVIIFLLIYFLKILYYLYCWNVCLLAGSLTCHSPCWGQRTTCGGQFFPATLWVLGIELRSQDLMASPVVRWAILITSLVDV